jgi:predicted dehydrogenase
LKLGKEIMTEKLRVAVAGASGIGKHHAKWHHTAGCEVVAFLGSNAGSCAATAQALQALFPFSGRGFDNWEQLLAEMEPDIVDICVPNELHYEFAFAALEAGCHVLCEKPLVWQRGEELETLFSQGQRLVAEANRRELNLGICTQYAASLPHYMRLYRPLQGALKTVETYYAEMEVPARGRWREATEVWVDMGPHPLSLLLAWVPDGVIDPESLEVGFERREAKACFDFISAQGRCRSKIVVRDAERANLLRRFGVNEIVVDCEGRSDESGVYRSILRRGRTEVMGEDFMSRLISQFADAVRQDAVRPLVTGETGLRNLELLLQIMKRVDS